MAEQRGGMRRPQNPAPVSGPGSLSQRTDGGPQQVMSDVSGMPYGENQELEEMQSAAPMSASGQATARATRRGGAGRATQRAAQRMAPLMSPTQRPDEPVTAGAPFGPGAGPAPVSAQSKRMTSMLSTVQNLYERTGDPTLKAISDVLYRRGV
jgi:hypothetical protein